MRIKWLFVGLLGVLIFYACPSVEIHTQQNPSTSITAGSPETSNTVASEEIEKKLTLTSSFDSTHYMIELSEKAMSELNWDKNFVNMEREDFTSDVQELICMYLPLVFQESNICDEVVSICPCGLVLVRAEVARTIMLAERGTKQRPRPTTLSKGIIKSIDNNHFIPIPTLDVPNTVPAWADSIIIPRPWLKKDTIRVAILDSGIDINHDSLKHNIWTNPLEYSASLEDDLIDNDNNGIVNDVYGYNFGDFNHDLRDYKGHGTHIAGIVNGSFRNDFFGNTEFDESLELMNIKVFSEKLHYASLFRGICAMHYAIDEGADIINVSWGYKSKDTLSALENVIEKADENYVFIVAAAGNARFYGEDGVNIDYKKNSFWPASFSVKYKNVISVGEAEEFNNRARLTKASNYGRKAVNFAAKGAYIRSTFINSQGDTTLSGTSIAAPAISRYIAWLKFQELQQLNTESGVYNSLVNELRVLNLNDWVTLIPNSSSSHHEVLKRNVALKSNH